MQGETALRGSEAWLLSVIVVLEGLEGCKRAAVVVETRMQCVAAGERRLAARVAVVAAHLSAHVYIGASYSRMTRLWP